MSFPQHIRDQIEAGIKHRDKWMADAGIGLTSPELTARRDEFIVNALTGWRKAGEAMCPHLANTGGPIPFYLPLGDPRLLMCGECYGRWSRSLDLVEDRTCDLCKRYFPDGLHVMAVTSDLLTLLGGICPDCAAIR